MTESNSLPLYLISGGWNPAGFAETYGRFVRASTQELGRRILIIVTDEIAEEALHAIRKAGIFSSLGVSDDEIQFHRVSRAHPLTVNSLIEHDPTGLIIWGGTTANYWDAVCADASWIDYLNQHNVPYAGVSAGSQIVSSRALIDGWTIHDKGASFPVAPESISEGINELEIRDGLGLLFETIDVHATSEGGLSRLMHAVEHESVPIAYAIDDDTLLHIEAGIARVHGLGHVYRIERLESGRVLLDLFSHGSQFNVVTTEGHP